MNAVPKFTALVIAASATFYVQATTLPFVDFTYVPGSLDVISAPFGGTLVESMVSSISMTGIVANPSWIRPTSGGPQVMEGVGTHEETNIGALRSAVYDTGFGLDYYYQITNDPSSMGNLNTLLGWFKPLEREPVDLFQTSAGFGSFETGTVPIHTVARTGISDLWDTSKVGTNLMWVNFAPDSAVTPGSASYIEIIRTTGFSRSSVADFSLFSGTGQGGGGVTGFVPWSEPLAFVEPVVPAIPEPEEYALMLAGLGLVGAVVRRRKASQV